MPRESELEKLGQRFSGLLANDPQFLAALPQREVAESIVRPGAGLADLMRAVALGYADRPALGQRVTEVVAAPDDGANTIRLLPRYATLSYGQLWEMVTELAAALGDQTVQPGDRVATLGFSSVEYTAVDMAIPLLGAVSVPLHAGAGAGQLQPMVDETRPCIIACSGEYLAHGVELAVSSTPPQRLLVFDFRDDLDEHRLALDAVRTRLADTDSTVVVETLAMARQRGRTLPPPRALPVDSDRLAAILYTSGSTGSPKGAMQPEGLVCKGWGHIAAVLVEHGFAVPAITLNYLPMSHTAGRSMLYATLGAGGTAYFAGASDLSTMLDDLALVRPTQLNFVPRIWEMLHSRYLSEVKRRHGAHGDEDRIEQDVLDDLRERILGGRYLSALTGSAPISDELFSWVERLLGTHLINGLGATESGPVIIDGKLQRPPVYAYKLVDVPELGYFSTDRPHARGELLIKSSALFSGYYNRPELTADVFDEEGFYRTGDVVAQTGPDQFRYVDRRNNVLKLSQGEFVTISKLEAIYSNCESIHQIYVYGNSERSFLLAVVVPTDEAIGSHDDAELKAVILRSLRCAAQDAHLQSYEVPRDIIIETTPFSLDNGLLTGIHKPSLPKLKERYGDCLERRYDDIALAQDDRLRQLADRADRRPIIDTVCAAADALLGGVTGVPVADTKFIDLGGDSLSALAFTKVLEDIFGVEVPVAVIISPAGDMQSIADHIHARRQPSDARPTFAGVHPADTGAVRACDLTLDKFIDAALLDAAPRLPAPHADGARTVLLTGATGYLGRYLALHWLERMKKVGGNLICLVRAKDDAAARARLDAGFDSGDPDLLSHYHTLATDHLEVLAADKSEPYLGLDQQRWRRLADTVDLIIDSAALVNHMLPYQQLFGPNVVGTAEVIRLAVTARKKRIAYVSSVGVGATIAPANSARMATSERSAQSAASMTVT